MDKQDVINKNLHQARIQNKILTVVNSYFNGNAIIENISLYNLNITYIDNFDKDEFTKIITDIDKSIKIIVTDDVLIKNASSIYISFYQNDFTIDESFYTMEKAFVTKIGNKIVSRYGNFLKLKEYLKINNEIEITNSWKAVLNNEKIEIKNNELCFVIAVNECLLSISEKNNSKLYFTMFQSMVNNLIEFEYDTYYHIKLMIEMSDYAFEDMEKNK